MPKQDLMSVRLCGVEKSAIAIYLLHGCTVPGEFKACKFNLIWSKVELLRVDGNPVSAAGIHPVCSLEVALI